MDEPLVRLDELLTSQPLAVLATSHDGAPYASLVAMAHDGRGRVYFATSKSTRKWGNLAANPQVALLIDDRDNEPADFHRAAAATGVGTASECAGGDADYARDALLERHPHLAGFLASPSTAIARVDVERWYVVTRFQAVACIECTGHDRV